MLDQRGVAERFVSAGQQHPSVGYAGIRLDITDFPTRHNYLLALWQREFEPIMGGWVDELGVPILRGREVVGFAQDETGVDVVLSDDASLRAAYLVGCDGGRSAIRKTAGIEFPGLDPSTSWMIAQVEMDEEPEVGVRREGGGIGPVDREEGGGPYGVVLKEQQVDHDRRAHAATTCARPSSTPTGPTTGRTAPTGSRASPTRAAKRPRTATTGCCSPATPRTSIRRRAARA